MQFATPQNQDMFSRYMAAKFDQKELISLSGGFQSFFGRPETGGQTLYSPDALVAEIDIIKGNEKTAALVPRGNVTRLIGGGKKNVAKERSTSFARIFPLSEEEGNIGAHQLLLRGAGTTPYERKTQLERMRDLAYSEHVELIRRQVRLFERLSAQAIRTGFQDAILGTTKADEKYDFRRNANNTVIAPLAWTNPAADIDADCNNAWNQVRTVGKVSVDMVGCSSSAMAALIKSTAMQGLADVRRYEMVKIGLNDNLPAKVQYYVNKGWTCFGRIMTTQGHELWLMNYADQFDDEGGNPVKYLPDGEVIFWSSQARCDRHFGPGERMPVTSQEAAWYREMFGFNMSAPPMPMNMGTAGAMVTPGMFYCDAYADVAHKGITIRTQTAPIFAPTQVDSFYLLTQVTA